jgi:hypothetical protein
MSDAPALLNSLVSVIANQMKYCQSKESTAMLAVAPTYLLMKFSELMGQIFVQIVLTIVLGKQMEIKTFKERASIIRQDSINTPVQHLGWITSIRTLRVLDSGKLRETKPKTPDRVISVEVEGQKIPLDVEFSQALFLEFFPGFTGFGQDSESEAEEYMKQRYWK